MLVFKNNFIGRKLAAVASMDRFKFFFSETRTHN